MTPIEAAEAALQGLLELCAERDANQGDPATDDPRITAAGYALKALRAALPALREVEPVADEREAFSLWCQRYNAGHKHWQFAETSDTGRHCFAAWQARASALYAAPPAPAQPAQGGGVVDGAGSAQQMIDLQTVAAVLRGYPDSMARADALGALKRCSDRIMSESGFWWGTHYVRGSAESIAAVAKLATPAPAAPDEPGAGVVEVLAPSTDLLRKFRGTQAFLESCWRSANSNIGVDRDDVALAIRTLQEGLDEASAALAAQPTQEAPR